MKLRFVVMLVVFGLVILGCMHVDNPQPQSLSALNDDAQTELVGSLLTDQATIDALRARYESSTMYDGGLAKEANEVEFAFDSTTFFQIQEDVIAMYTPGVLKDKNFFLLSSMNDEGLYSSDLIFKSDEELMNTGYGVLSVFTPDGKLFGIITINTDTSFSYSLEIDETTGDQQLLGWWDDFTLCLDDVSPFVYMAGLGGPGFASGAVSGALLGCSTVASIEWALE